VSAPKDAGQQGGEAQQQEGDATSRAVTEEAFAEVSRRIEACFDEVTIEDLCERGEALGYRRRPPSRYVYVI
jgi:DNA-binding IscR family transcriptional regulator